MTSPKSLFIMFPCDKHERCVCQRPWLRGSSWSTCLQRRESHTYPHCYQPTGNNYVHPVIIGCRLYDRPVSLSVYCVVDLYRVFLFLYQCELSHAVLATCSGRPWRELADHLREEQRNSLPATRLVSIQICVGILSQRLCVHECEN